MRRSYDQYCGLARALDLVGERWTLLIVRDLAIAPRRFTDLMDGLPGLGTSLLSQRLRHLEDAGIVGRQARRRPDGGVVYELTDRGHQLARAIGPLAVWGASALGPRADGERFRPEWLTYFLEASFRPELAQGVRDTYEFRIEDAVLWVVVADGTIEVTQERPGDSDFVAILDVQTLADLGAGAITPQEAVASKRARFHGDLQAGARALQLLGTQRGTMAR
jgi:DNA-binding HxlR family transcriptional regulator/putative sterol carrier protein